MELLKATNWMPWKWQMHAVLHDLGLDKYIVEDTQLPGLADLTRPTTSELEKAMPRYRSELNY